jgi:hypothetical protein
MATNEARLTAIAGVAEQDETAESLRFAQNNLLSELPGVAFGLITLAYIVTSLIALL